MNPDKFKPGVETREELNEVLEDIFKNDFYASTNNKFDQQFKGQLSLFSNKVGNQISQENIAGKCIVFCTELLRCLSYRGISATRVSNNKPKNHEYLILDVNGENIIIDPTVVQWIPEHKHVFVGTRSELKQIILEHIKFVSPELARPELEHNAIEFYNEIWN